MPSRVFFQEIKRFFKENVKIYFSFLLLGLLSFGIMIFFQSMNGKDKTSVEIDEDARMSTFVFYVENSEQYVYNNSNFLDTVFLDKKYVEEAEKATGIELSKLIDEQLESDFIPTLLDRGYIGVGRDVHDETMLFQAKLGSEKDNLAVANYYYNLIVNEEIPFLDNKNVYIVKEPYLVELEEENIAPSTTELEPSILVLILKGVIFSAVGLLIGIIFAFLYHLLTNKINYSFSYEVEKDDLFFIERSDRNQLISLMVNPDFGEKIILSQYDLPVKLKEELGSNSENRIVYSNQLLKENPNKHYDEIIFCIVESKTDKQWYYQQRESLKNFNNHIKVIQIPNELIK